MGKTENQFETFIDRLHLEAARTLHPLVPLVTERAAHLHEHQGVVVGALFEMWPLKDLVHGLKELPGVWKPRKRESIHSSFGVVHESSDAQEDARQVSGRVHELFRAARFDRPALEDITLRVSKSAIVLHGTPNKAAFALRQLLLAGVGSLPCEPHSGTIVLAEATAEVGDRDHELTDDWLEEARAGLLPRGEVRLRQALACSFSVKGMRMDLNPREQTTFFLP